MLWGAGRLVSGLMLLICTGPNVLQAKQATAEGGFGLSGILGGEQVVVTSLVTTSGKTKRLSCPTVLRTTAHGAQGPSYRWRL